MAAGLVVVRGRAPGPMRHGHHTRLADAGGDRALVDWNADAELWVLVEQTTDFALKQHLSRGVRCSDFPTPTDSGTGFPAGDRVQTPCERVIDRFARAGPARASRPDRAS